MIHRISVLFLVVTIVSAGIVQTTAATRPYALAFLPNGSMLITERAGRLHPRFTENHWLLYLLTDEEAGALLRIEPVE